MPNWVYNGLTIEGKPESVKSLMTQMNQPFTVMHDSWDVVNQSYTKKNTLYPSPIFAFWNIVKPTDLEAYHKQPAKWEGGPLNFDGDDWYNWNVRNWGTKWDVAVSSNDTHPDTYMEETANGENHVVYYNFETAWSRPMPALINLSSQYPDLLFTLSYEEETGWGGECEILRGSVISESEYDTMCRECDAKDCMEWCEECDDEVCTICQYNMVESCPTHEKAEA
jgi:hypothetical protein